MTALSRKSEGLDATKMLKRRTRRLKFENMPLHKRKEIEDKVKKELSFGKMKNYGIRMSDIMFDGNNAI